MSTATYEHRTGPQAPKYAHLANYLKENPGTWATVRTAETDNGAWVAAHQIRTGRRAAFRPAGHYDAYVEDRDVIACYVGNAGGTCSERVPESDTNRSAHENAGASK